MEAIRMWPRNLVVLFSLGAAVLPSFSHAGTSVMFAEPDYLLPGHGILAVEAADIDGDGDSDLVALSSVDVMSVFRNQGEGRFASAETLAAPGTHLDFLIADMDGDGSPDCVTANFGEGTVTVMLNDGGGIFGPPTTFDAPGVSVCRGLAAGDLDGDGDRDLLVGDAFNASKAVLLNNGSGAFAQALPFTAGGTCIAVAIADLDGDGDRDAVTVFNGVWAHCNNGDGTFAPAVILATGEGHTSVAIADVNGDGGSDVAVSRSTSNGNNVARVFHNDGAACGSFTLIDYPISTLARDISLADLNGDGLIDLATSHVSSVDRVSVLLNLGEGAYGPAHEFFPGTYPQSLAIADVNADGLNDLATANQFHNPHSVGLLINVTPISVKGDITGDGVVNVSDLLAVIDAWGSCPGPPQLCAADIAPHPGGDGAVNVLDLLLVINNWG
jgi:hypothetical protein